MLPIKHTLRTLRLDQSYGKARCLDRDMSQNSKLANISLKNKSPKNTRGKFIITIDPNEKD